MKQKVFSIFALLLMAVSGAWAKDYYAPSTDEVIILNDVYNAPSSGKSSHSAIAWGGNATRYDKKAGDPNNGGQPTSSDVSCYSVKGNGQGKNITLSITGVSKVIVYHEKKDSRYIELRDGSKDGNIIGSGEKDTYYTEVALTATNQYSIFLHGTSDGSDDQDVYVYAIKLIAAPAATYAVTLAEGTEDGDNWTISPAEAAAGSPVTATYSGEKKVKSVKAVKKAAYAANEYNEGSWDGTKVVFTKQTAASVTAVANSDAAVTWDAGWYTVSGNVTITGNVTLGADTHLILQDGATLTINGKIDCNTNGKNLYIYGQKKGDGKLIVTNSNDNGLHGSASKFIEIHGGEITATTKNNALYAKGIKVYGGKITATATGNSSGITFGNGGFDVYGGEIEAEATNTSTSMAFHGFTNGFSFPLTVYGGKVTATGNANGSGFHCYVKSGTSGIKFYFSDNGTDWDAGTSYASATQVGYAAATKKRYAKAE